MNNAKITIGFVIILVTIIIFFADSPERILGRSDGLETEMDAIPFAVARNTLTRHYDDNGTLGYTFDASKLEYYKETRENLDEFFTLVDHPKLVFFQADGPPWELNAKRGKILEAEQQIILWDEVLLKHIDADGVLTEIHTDELKIDPVHKLAKTAEPVKIDSQKMALEGVGMTADLVAEKIQLLSKVRGLHDPN